jgi:CheY-like chemotaxis protein
LAIFGYLGVMGAERQGKNPVAVRRNGEEALVRAQEGHADLILMDIQMPGMDGLESIRQIRADARVRDIPIIALTALAMLGNRERCLQVGANDYLTKPVDLNALLTSIAALLTGAKPRNSHPSTIRQTAPQQ